MMKTRTPLLTSLVAGALLLTGTAFAQQTSRTATPPPIVTVRSVQPAAPTIAPAPAFQTLAGHSRWITVAQAAAYPPLANDFLNASHGGDRVSAAQYAAWVKQLN